MIDCNFLAFSDSPLDFYKQPVYKSGLIDDEKSIYTHGYTGSKHPTLALPYNLTDNEGNSIPAGFYEIVLSENKKFLLFIESNKLKAKIPVFKLIENKTIEDKELEPENIKKVNKKDAKRKAKAKPVRKPSNYFELRERMLISAKIVDTKHPYYIVEYSDASNKAYAYIAK